MSLIIIGYKKLYVNSYITFLSKVLFFIPNPHKKLGLGEKPL